MRWRLLSTTLLLSCAIYPGKGIADQCEKLDKEGLLIYQQFKKSKMCKDSTINAGWTDCLFKAYGTKEVAIKWSAAPDMTPQTVLYRRPVAQFSNFQPKIVSSWLILA
ncbi:hypothetical protein, partial [Raoultella ornithinolytica]|uniref:hypothetical protein n=1 Tax=Raoultella ornithinolytica TaxID=54291 RepID=UPI00384FDBF8